MDAVIEIPLTRGFVALIDSADDELVSQYRWHASGSPGREYAATHLRGDNRHVRMHRLLMGFPRSQIDHRNGNRMDNRRENLRLCSPMENSRNSAKYRSGKTSRFKGVHSSGSNRNPFRAVITVRGVNRYLGYFPTEEQAALAYDAAARELFGEFARLNFQALQESAL